MDPQLELTNRKLDNLRKALDSSAIVAVTDTKGNIIHVNQKFCDISQYAREELLGKNHRIINSGFHSKEFFAQMWKTIVSGNVWEAEVRNRAKDGSYYWVNTCIVPMLDENQKPYEYVSIRYEITARKEAETKLTSYSEKLEQSNRELQDFASIAAHDLQEPLRKIRAFGDRLVVKCKDSLPPDGLEYLDRIQNSAKRMQSLIDALLTYSRVNTRGGNFSRVNLNTVLDEVVSDLEMQISSVGGKVIVQPLASFEADAVQMRQLFQNLVGNALKFHKPGENPEVQVKSEVSDSSCIISVTDNGIGFDEKYLDRIFTIFQRLHGREEFEGTGLGLAVCRRIVERHGGTISAKSVPGQGASFIVTLPVLQNKREGFL